jgi:hypothetical protein
LHIASFAHQAEAQAMSESEHTSSKQSTEVAQVPGDSDADKDKSRSPADEYNQWFDQLDPPDLADFFRRHLAGHGGDVRSANDTAIPALHQ